EQTRGESGTSSAPGHPARIARRPLERATAHQRDETLVGEITAAFAANPAVRSAYLQQAKAVHGEQAGMQNQHGIEMVAERGRDEGGGAGRGSRLRRAR